MAETTEAPKEKGKNKAHRKDKPWDTDDIDHGKSNPSNQKTTRVEHSLKSPRLQRFSQSIVKSICEKYGVRSPRLWKFMEWRVHWI
ncbi:hypothetical protein CC2G_010910 [Coprinopsis cinerea AmutBmut pab1-1]|nr:hypothetical protein CC2G_010910 [Coprinopsis cinerea AmutBmut pab1-1]